MLAELNGIDVLVSTAHTGLTSRAKVRACSGVRYQSFRTASFSMHEFQQELLILQCGAMHAECPVTSAADGKLFVVCAQAAAARALQRLQDLPELKDALGASTARDLQLEASMSPAHSSQLNSSSAAPATAAALAAAAAAGSPHAMGPMSTPGASPAAGIMQRSPVQTAQAAASAAVGSGPAGGSSTAGGPGMGFAVGGSEPDDLKQLAQVLASGNSRWLREKAAAAVEQLATDNPSACRCAVCSTVSRHAVVCKQQFARSAANYTYRQSHAFVHSVMVRVILPLISKSPWIHIIRVGIFVC